MKKILALVLALTLALGTFSFAAAAPEDVVGTDYEDAVVRLGALGIIAGFPDGTYKPAEPVTRAQFAKIVVAALGVGEAAQYAAGTTKFADVPADHWAAGYINVAVDVGVINGYPDGTFAPENPVTFAEAIKMIVAALGYTPKAEAMGGYPGGYLAVAAEEGITDDVNVVSNLAADRGAIAIMVDNSLTVPLMVQKTYGQYPEYEADEDKTLLNTKLGVEELEKVYVTGVPLSNSTLEENEIEIDGDVYEVIGDLDINSLLGLKVNAWADKKDRVFFVEVKTDAKDIKYDTVKSLPTGKVELKVADKKYDWADDAKVFINFDEAEVRDVNANMYGRIVLEKDEVVFANLFDFRVNAGVVKEVDGSRYTYYVGDSDSVLRLSNYDDVYVFDGEFNAIDEEAIDVDSVIYAWNTSDEIFIMVVNEKVEGELSKISTSKATIDGKAYNVASNATASDNEDKDFADFNDSGTISEVVENLAGEEVVALLDLNGEIRHLSGDAKVTSGTIYGLVLDAYKSGSGYVASIFTADGKAAYEFEKKADYDKLGNYDFDAGDMFIPVAFKLNSDEEIAKDSFLLAANNDISNSVGGTSTAFGNAKTDPVAKAIDASANAVKFNSDHDYMEVTGLGTFFMENAVIFKMEADAGGYDTDDVGVVDWDNLKGADDNTTMKAYLVGEDGKSAKFMVIYDNYEDISDETMYGIVLEKPFYSGGKWRTVVLVEGEGEVEYKVAGSSTVAKGDILEFKVSADGELKPQSTHYNKNDYVNNYDVVEKRDGRSIKLVGGLTKRVASNAAIYDVDEDGDLNNVLTYADIEKDDCVVVLDDGTFFTAIIVINEMFDVAPTPPTDITFEYLATEKIKVSNVEFDDAATGAKNDYILKISGDALAVAVYTDVETLSAAGATLEFNVAGIIPANGVYKVELINAADLDTSVASANLFLPKTTTP